jgi:alpha-D-xyloside xylohydrolase
VLKLLLPKYQGTGGNFTLYNDEGDNYNYEKGKYRLANFHWNEKKQLLTIHKAQGNYAGAQTKQVFNIVWFDGANSRSQATRKKVVVYNGQLTKKKG